MRTVVEGEGHVPRIALAREARRPQGRDERGRGRGVHQPRGGQPGECVLHPATRSRTGFSLRANAIAQFNASGRSAWSRTHGTAPTASSTPAFARP